MTREFAGCAGVYFIICFLTTGCGNGTPSPEMETMCSAGEECDDENPCTENDKCDSDGECIGEPIQCDDKRECTDDACDAAGKCIHDLKAGYCLINGFCYEDGEAKPDNPCMECTTAVSRSEWMNDDTNECGADDKCHTGAHCADGECMPGTELLDCNDDNECTDDSCDPELGCVFSDTDGVCDDGNLCTEGDTCAEGVCAGTLLECDDDNECTKDDCDPFQGCTNQPTSGPCDDGDGCTVDDLCGDDGICVGAPCGLQGLSCVAGECVEPACGALVFDGQDAFVEVPYNESFAFGTSDFTVEAWVYYGNLDAGPQKVHRLVVLQAPDGGHRWSLENHYWNPGNPTFGAGFNVTLGETDNYEVVHIKGALPEQIGWHHLAVARQEENWFVFMDGALSATYQSAASVVTTPDSLFLGSALGTGHFFEGVLDEVRISSTARYTEEFIPLHQLGEDEETQALWRFNEGQGDTAYDSSGNNNHGTVHGASWTDESPGPVCCAADCEDKECGGDGCGGTCGLCEGWGSCGSDGLCVGVPGLAWISLEGGTYEMGCSPGDSGCENDEKPPHQVTVSAFDILETEVTQAQYLLVTGQEPSSLSGCPDCPVETVSWDEARAFCEAIGGRLPSEAEWEYAARGGTATKVYCGDDPSCIDSIAWHWDNSEGETHPAKTKTPNDFGLYDMLGNVWEWVEDWYAGDYYCHGPESTCSLYCSDCASQPPYLEYWGDPPGPPSGQVHVLRGGSWLTPKTKDPRASDRGYSEVVTHEWGFRCAKDCTPSCSGKECGNDECGGSCGECGDGLFCFDGLCVEECIPDCDGKECGPDGCLGECGVCPQNHICTIDAACICVPECTDKECGSDGCIGYCGTCPMGKSCEAGQCVVKCGDGQCDNGENCSTCVQDCGSCITPGFVKIVKGSFWMGSPSGCPGPAGYGGDCTLELGRGTDETLHYVTLTHDFEMQVTEVTQGEWKAAFGNWNPSYFPLCGANCPVEQVSWYDSLAYANWKSEQAGLTPCYVFSGVKCVQGGDPGNGSQYSFCLDAAHGGIDSASVSLAEGAEKPHDCEGYRLPTESEWEVAARAGGLTAFYPSDGNNGTITQTGNEPLDPNLDQISWYGGNSKATYNGAYDCSAWYAGSTTCGPQPGGGKETNAWGLKDMSGNVMEWCWDWDGMYPVGTLANPDVDPIGVGEGIHRVCRGGGWIYGAEDCRSASRLAGTPDVRINYLGCRLARTL